MMDNLLRVLHVYDHIGINCGIISVVMNWYRNIDRSIVQFDFLVSCRRTISYHDEIVAMGGNVYYMNDSETLRINELTTLLQKSKKFMSENAKKYEIVHLHTNTFAYPYLFYAKKYGVPIRISHAHSMNWGNTTISSLRNRVLLIPLKKNSTYFMACSSEAGRSYFQPLGIHNFDIVLNGVDFKKYDRKKISMQHLRRNLEICDKTLIVGHVSNMSKIKNVPFVIDVFKIVHDRYPNSKLLLVGKDELPPGVSEKIEKLALKEHVINLGVRNDIPECLNAMDVCLMPSKSEGLGLVVVEAQAANVPVLTSLGFPKEVYVSELVKKLELDAIKWADAVIQVKILKKSEVNLDLAIANFEIRMIGKKIENTYLKLVANNMTNEV